MAPLKGKVVLNGNLQRREIASTIRGLSTGAVRSLTLRDVALSLLLWTELSEGVLKASTFLTEVVLCDTVMPFAAHRTLTKWGAIHLKSLSLSNIFVLPKQMADITLCAECIKLETSLLESLTASTTAVDSLPLPEAWCAVSTKLTQCRDSALSKTFTKLPSNTPPSALLGAKGLALYNEGSSCGVSPQIRGSYTKAWTTFLEKFFAIELGVGRALTPEAAKRVATAVSTAITPDAILLEAGELLEGVHHIVVNVVVPKVIDSVMRCCGFALDTPTATVEYLRVISALKLDSLYPHEWGCALDSIAIGVESACRVVAEKVAEKEVPAVEVEKHKMEAVSHRQEMVSTPVVVPVTPPPLLSVRSEGRRKVAVGGKTPQPRLRFAPGVRVLCKVEEDVWKVGRITALWEHGYPYRIELDNGDSLYAPKDSDSCVLSAGRRV